MAITRINLDDDATWARAWSVADAAERATLLATAGAPLGLARGDWIFQVDTSQWYIFPGGSALLAIVDGADVARLSQVNTFTAIRNIFSRSAGPEIILQDTSQAANQRNFGIINGTGALGAGFLEIGAYDDAFTAFSTVLAFDRATQSTTLAGLLDLLAGQVEFPATQNPSSNANTLDDYEEGTWTPTDASGAGLSFTTTFTAEYIKLGQLVFVNAAFTYPATADGSNAKVGGLPFTSSASQGGLTAGYSGSAGYREWLVIQSSTEVWPFVANTGGQYTNAGLSSATVRISGCYRSAA